MPATIVKRGIRKHRPSMTPKAQETLDSMLWHIKQMSNAYYETLSPYEDVWQLEVMFTLKGMPLSHGLWYITKDGGLK